MNLKMVFFLAVVLGTVGVTPLLADLPKERPVAVKKELKTLEGKWRKVKFLHFDFESAPAPGDDDVIVEFKGDSIDFNGSAVGVVVELDAATDPKCLDFEVRSGGCIFRKGSTYESIYKRDGDSLIWAVYHGRGKNRPTAFDKPTERGVIVMIFDRIKE